MKIQAYLSQRQAIINRALGKILPQTRQTPRQIHQAMRYSVLGEGKRIRPILALAACEAVGGKIANALDAACALELIHAYSLVHDDLPAMDNDDFRRGKPSCHKQFGEALGILTGDALLTLSFALLARGNGGSSNVHLRVVQEVAQAIGTDGMIGGQVADIQAAGLKSGPATIEYINAKKTGALISVALRIGALLGGASQREYQALAVYGRQMGLVFQLVDDLLDGDGAVRVDGANSVRRRAERLTHSAILALKPLGKRGQVLKELAQLILTRGS